MKNNLLRACLASMFAPCAMFGIGFPAIAFFEQVPVSAREIFGSFLFGFAALIYTIPATLGYGLPMFLLLRKLKLANLFTCVLTALAPLAYAALTPWWEATIGHLLLFGAFFLLSSLAFWFFARRTLENETSDVETEESNAMNGEQEFEALKAYLVTVPSIRKSFGQGFDETGEWWMKFAIDIDHPLAWQVVQELGHVLNYLSIGDRLPTVFKPVSPPPYMNGGPKSFLSWIIECSDPEFKPDTVAKWLEGRLPKPVHDSAEWDTDE